MRCRSRKVTASRLGSHHVTECGGGKGNIDLTKPTFEKFGVVFVRKVAVPAHKPYFENPLFTRGLGHRHTALILCARLRRRRFHRAGRSHTSALRPGRQISKGARRPRRRRRRGWGAVDSTCVDPLTSYTHIVQTTKISYCCGM